MPLLTRCSWLPDEHLVSNSIIQHTKKGISPCQTALGTGWVQDEHLGSRGSLNLLSGYSSGKQEHWPYLPDEHLVTKGIALAYRMSIWLPRAVCSCLLDAHLVTKSHCATYLKGISPSTIKLPLLTGWASGNQWQFALACQMLIW